METLITIKTGHGRLRIYAQVIGKFAVDSNAAHDSVSYIVTHVATGRAAATGIASRSEAEDLARRLDAAIAEDITPDRIYSEEYKAFARAVRSVLQPAAGEREGA